ncbi:MAG: 50S ribosomal protein L25 [bacterium]|nr:50S ribosomal protein L25 [bacterium]
MEELVIQATNRPQTGSAECRRLRRRGLLPGTIYGHGTLRNITLNAHDFNQLLHRLHAEHAVVKCKVDKDNFDVLIKDVQRHTVTHNIIHVDFMVVDLDEVVTVAIPVEIVGEADGVKNQGGVLELLRRDVEVRCKARDIPRAITVDVSGLRVHDVLCVRDLPALAGIEYHLDGETPIVTVAAPTVHEEKVPGAEVAAPEEPEVITARKPAEEEEAGAEKGEKKE